MIKFCIFHLKKIYIKFSSCLTYSFKDKKFTNEDFRKNNLCSKLNCNFQVYLYLRDFLRLGSPLNCRSIDEKVDGPKSMETSWTQSWPISRASSIDERKTPLQVENKLKTAGEAVPLTRVKCLVSMTTPKDARINGSAVTPAFVEFEMTTEGFGCLYLPSIAPQGPPTPSVVSGVVGVDSTVIGGIGTGIVLGKIS